MREVSIAIKEFKQYMSEMVNEERTSSAVDKENLMSVLVRAAEAEARDGKGRNAFTDQEIFGNLFIYNLAGHDTTANTLNYAITLLAMEPHWQAWVREEIESVHGSFNTSGEPDYEKVFPQLKRCLAVMVSSQVDFIFERSIFSRSVRQLFVDGITP